MSKTLIREILNISAITAVFGMVQLLITIPLGYFGYPVIWGTLLGCITAVFNFSLMGIILEKSLANSNGASGIMSIGYILRLFIIGAAVVWAMKADYLNYICVIIPLLFPQAAIFIINLIKVRRDNKNERA